MHISAHIAQIEKSDLPVLLFTQLCPNHWVLLRKKPRSNTLMMWIWGLMLFRLDGLPAIHPDRKLPRPFCKLFDKQLVKRHAAFLVYLVALFYFKPCGIHCRQYQQRQHGGHKQAAGNSNSHRSPKDAAHQGYHAEDGCSCRQHNRPKTQYG